MQFQVVRVWRMVCMSGQPPTLLPKAAAAAASSQGMAARALCWCCVAEGTKYGDVEGSIQPASRPAETPGCCPPRLTRGRRRR
jgi:hypothetical protein